MFIVFILLWIIAAIFIISEPRNPVNRWIGLTVFFAGLGGFNVVFVENLIPVIQHNFGADLILNQCLEILNRLFFTSAAFFHPYTYFRFGIEYSGLFKSNRLKNILGLILLIPVIAMYLLFPMNAYVSILLIRKLQIITVFWAGLYIILANLLLIFSCFKVEDPRIRQERFITAIIFGPLTLIDLVTGYILIVFNIEVWRYNFLFIILGFILFLILIINYGILGVKLKFEKSRLWDAIRVTNSGISILNHSLKNDLAKISMASDNIHRHYGEDSYLGENIRVIDNSTAHMLAMVSRIREYLGDVPLDESICNLTDLVQSTVHMFKNHFQSNNISSSIQMESDFRLRCDRTHLQEVLSNIIMNALEATKPGGAIQIRVYKYQKFLTISIKDNGIGISKTNLKHIFEPFFSTKKHHTNFGLGLSYSYNIMKKHGGSLTVESKENSGTTVFLNFPLFRVKMNNSLNKGYADEPNQSVNCR